MLVTRDAQHVRREPNTECQAANDVLTLTYERNLHHDEHLLAPAMARPAWQRHALGLQAQWYDGPAGRTPAVSPASRAARARQAAEDLPDESGRYADLPPRLEARLMAFQRAGVRFALQRGGRALIGDEMGLGKTVQARPAAARPGSCCSACSKSSKSAEHRSCMMSA